MNRYFRKGLIQFPDKGIYVIDNFTGLVVHGTGYPTINPSMVSVLRYSLRNSRIMISDVVRERQRCSVDRKLLLYPLVPKSMPINLPMARIQKKVSLSRYLPYD